MSDPRSGYRSASMPAGGWTSSMIGERPAEEVITGIIQTLIRGLRPRR